MEIRRPDPSRKADAARFTGDVLSGAGTGGEEHPHVRVNAVQFAPGARTAWHSHPLGQILLVTEGRGLVQSRGQAIEEIGPGDLVVAPSDEWHWHGADSGGAMTHLSITEGGGSDRPETEWGDHVTDDEYSGPRASR